MTLSTKVVLLFLILSYNVLIINGDSCDCQCCIGRFCDLKVLPKTFEVHRCWYGGVYYCLTRCISEYPKECGSPSSVVIPACQTSSTTSLNVFIIIITILFINYSFVDFFHFLNKSLCILSIKNY
jgi:hypothetical protein